MNKTCKWNAVTQKSQCVISARECLDKKNQSDGSFVKTLEETVQHFERYSYTHSVWELHNINAITLIAIRCTVTVSRWFAYSSKSEDIRKAVNVALSKKKNQTSRKMAEHPGTTNSFISWYKNLVFHIEVGVFYMMMHFSAFSTVTVYFQVTNHSQLIVLICTKIHLNIFCTVLVTATLFILCPPNSRNVVNL